MVDGIRTTFGGHSYAGTRVLDTCDFGCGCWVGPNSQSGPDGVDPHGECPKNPTGPIAPRKKIAGKTTKQVAVHIPVDEFALLQQFARNQGMSIHQVSRQIMSRGIRHLAELLDDEPPEPVEPKDRS